MSTRDSKIERTGRIRVIDKCSLARVAKNRPVGFLIVMSVSGVFRHRCDFLQDLGHYFIQSLGVGIAVCRHSLA